MPHIDHPYRSGTISRTPGRTFNDDASRGPPPAWLAQQGSANPYLRLPKACHRLRSLFTGGLRLSNGPCFNNGKEQTRVVTSRCVTLPVAHVRTGIRPGVSFTQWDAITSPGMPRPCCPGESPPLARDAECSRRSRRESSGPTHILSWYYTPRHDIGESSWGTRQPRQRTQSAKLTKLATALHTMGWMTYHILKRLESL